MVVTGYPLADGRNMEIVDVENSTFTCTKIKSFPKQLVAATGGLINGLTPFLCGGWQDNSRNSKDCYKLMDSGSWAKDQIASLNTERHWAGFGSVVMNKDQLVVSGGKNSGGGYMKTIELVTPNSRAKTLSVQLPNGFSVHCHVPWDSETFLVTGGWRGGSLSETYFIHVNNETLTNGPRLKLARREHACAELNVLEKSYVIVSGGQGASKTTEVLDKGNVGQGWQQGKPI